MQYFGRCVPQAELLVKYRRAGRDVQNISSAVANLFATANHLTPTNGGAHRAANLQPGRSFQP